MQKLMSVLAIVVLSLLLIPTAQAGTALPPPFSCWVSSGGGFVCTGTFYAARASANATDYAYFRSSVVTKNFYAHEGGAFYTCVPAPDLEALWAAATSASPFASFTVNADGHGTCTDLIIGLDSRYLPGNGGSF
jgi:hypothetical protein